MSSRSDLSLKDAGLEVSREAVIRGTRDVSLINTRIGADSMATVKAARNLNVDGLTFSRTFEHPDGSHYHPSEQRGTSAASAVAD